MKTEFDNVKKQKILIVDTTSINGEYAVQCSKVTKGATRTSNIVNFNNDNEIEYDNNNVLINNGASIITSYNLSGILNEETGCVEIKLPNKKIKSIG